MLFSYHDLDMWHKLLTNASFQHQSQIAPIFACSWGHHMIWQLVYFIFMCILTSLTLLMEEIGLTGWYEESIAIDRVSYIPAGDRRISEPSTVRTWISIMSMFALIQPFPPWVESARRFARGYLVRLRTHQVTSPDALIFKGRWAAQIRMETSNTQVSLNATHFAGNQAMQINGGFWGISKFLQFENLDFERCEADFLQTTCSISFLSKLNKTCKHRCHRRMWRDAILAEEQMWAAVEAILKQLEIYASASLRFYAWIYLVPVRFKDDLKIHQWLDDFEEGWRMIRLRLEDIFQTLMLS